MNIGKSVVIKGELSGSEDLTIEGQVEGRIELRENVLTIGPNGKIKAEVFAKAVIVLGEVVGNVTASEKVDIRDNGSVDGDIASPRVAIAEGAHFRGSVDMQRRGTQARRRAARTPGRRTRRHPRRDSACAAADRSSWEPDKGCRQMTRGRPGNGPPRSTGAVMSDAIRSLTDLFGMFGRPPTGRTPIAASTETPARCRTSRSIPPRRSRSFSRYCSRARIRVIIDLGPVVGSNVTFFGEQLGCRIRVEDVAADIDRHVKAGTVDQLPTFFETRFTQAPDSVDGILCWDVFDYLDRPAAQALADGADAAAEARRRAAGVLQHRRLARAGLHEVRRRGRCQPAVSDLSGAASAAAGAAQSRHHQAVRRSARHGFVPDEDATCARFCSASPYPTR